MTVRACILGLVAAALLSGCRAPTAYDSPNLTAAEVAFLVPTVRWQELQRRAWYIRAERIGTAWTLHAKVDRGGLASSAYYVEADSFDAAVQGVLDRIITGEQR